MFLLIDSLVALRATFAIERFSASALRRAQALNVINDKGRAWGCKEQNSPKTLIFRRFFM
jgi:hypothetical protein